MTDAAVVFLILLHRHHGSVRHRYTDTIPGTLLPGVLQGSHDLVHVVVAVVSALVLQTAVLDIEPLDFLDPLRSVLHAFLVAERHQRSGDAQRLSVQQQTGRRLPQAQSVGGEWVSTTTKYLLFF